jgi:hypothetical protein
VTLNCVHWGIPVISWCNFLWLIIYLFCDRIDLLSNSMIYIYVCSAAGMINKCSWTISLLFLLAKVMLKKPARLLILILYNLCFCYDLLHDCRAHWVCMTWKARTSPIMNNSVENYYIKNWKYDHIAACYRTKLVVLAFYFSIFQGSKPVLPWLWRKFPFLECRMTDWWLKSTRNVLRWLSKWWKDPIRKQESSANQFSSRMSHTHFPTPIGPL